MSNIELIFVFNMEVCFNVPVQAGWDGTTVDYRHVSTRLYET